MIPESVKENWTIGENTKGVRFRTFHVLGKEKASVMAVTIPMNTEHTKFCTQFSYLSPKEKRGFCRQTAKDIALARLNSFQDVIDIELKDGERLGEYLKYIICAEANRKNIHWFESVSREDLV